MPPDAATSMTVSAWLARLFVALGGVVVATFIALAAWLGKPGGPALAIGCAIVLATAAIAAWLLHGRVARPADRLALDLAVITRDNPDHALRTGPVHRLGRLVAEIEALRQRLLRAKQDAGAVLADATAHAEQQKRRLEAILLDLSEGIVVCNLQHQVLLYNPAATGLLDPPLTIGLGRSVFAVLTQEPVLNALDRLRHRADKEAAVGDRFVCGTSDGRRLVQARLGLVLDSAKEPAGYVLALRDIGAELAAAARRDDLLQLATEGLRGPLANLRAAAETIGDNPDLPAEQRRAFDQVLLGESAVLSERLEALAQGYRELGGGQWLMSEAHSTDLLASLQRRLASGQPLHLTAVGLPVWLYCDSLSLLVLLEHLLRRLQAELRLDAFDAAFSKADRRIHLDIVWTGHPLPAAVIEGWLDLPLTGGLGPLTGRAVLRRHGSELWSQAGRHGEAMLRLPLPSAEPVQAAPGPGHTERPEFYDFDLLQRPLPTGELSERPLRQIAYVVLDLETTGLRPSEGDEIVEFAAVRVVNGRVLTMETFERLVNPGRSIPKESSAIHGITEAMVVDKPPIAVVLPQFRQFAADAVLVAHNAAFDMKFIGLAAARHGLAFEQPVIDTLLMSAHLDPGESDHSLDGIAARLGLDFMRRHSALGDALVTAGILVRQIERLEERGVTRFGDLVRVTNMAARIRAGQIHF